MRGFNKGKIIKVLIVFLFIFYLSFVFIKQQITLASYKNEKEYLSKEIEREDEYKKSLISKKDNVNSKEYIEQIAREKLNMYLPNERVYIDVGN